MSVKGKKSVNKKVDDTSLEPIEVKNGPVRPYLDIKITDEFVNSRISNSLFDKLYLIVLVIIGSAVRSHNLTAPNNVIDKESIVGGIISNYINREFFIGTTPPMANLFYFLVSFFNGFDGQFNFQPAGYPYPNKVPYVTFRLFSSVLGLLTVVLFYSTLRLTGVKMFVAFAISLALVFENGYVTISRYIFDESPYLFFIALAIYLFKRSQLYSMGSCKSYISLFGSAIALGCTVSTKWVGAFVIIWVGISLVLEFILNIGDLSKPVCSSIKHTTIKGLLCLIIPTFVYVLSFYTHFQLTTHISKDAEILSSEYRYELIGNNIPENVKAPVGLGSRVTIRHAGTYGGYLHSHDIFYTAGSKQQEITLYPYEDPKNEWYLELYSESGNPITNFTELVDGTKIRLNHKTHCRLHSHDHKPPVSENSDWQKEVSCYGYEGFEGDGNDDWIIEIDKDKSVEGAKEAVKAINTKFRLRHAMTGCHLFSHDTRLPASSYNQQEVTCATQGIEDLTLWYIESNDHDFLPDDTERVSYPRLSFLQKFVEIHKKIVYVSKKKDIPNSYNSNPLSWPFMSRGVELAYHNFENVYFIGNAIMWFAVTLFIIIFGLGFACELIAWQTGKTIFRTIYIIDFHIQTVEYLLGYAIYMAPYILLGGNYFIYEYLPAYYFGALALGHGFDALFVIPSNKIIKQAAYTVITLFVIGNIYFFQNRKALAYGSMWSHDSCEASKWLSSWDYDCNGYTLSVDQYQAQKSQRVKTDDVASFSYGFPAPTSEAEMIQDSIVDEMINEAESKAVFVDSNGNKLDPEEVKRMVKEDGAILKKSTIHE